MSNSISYLIFLLNHDEYGIDISYAKEIIHVPKDIVHLPNSPSYFKGIFSLRGSVIPILDLKAKYNVEKSDCFIETERILVLEIKGVMISLLVDDISEIIAIDDAYVSEPNAMISIFGKQSVKGIGRVDDRLILILDAEKFKNDAEENKIKQEELI